MIADAEHERVLATCVDVPEQPPAFPLPIDAVGIGNKTLWVKLPTGLTPFAADIRVNLPERVKGIHMSRIEGVIADLLSEAFTDIGDYALALAEGVVRTQEGSRAEVKLSGKLPLLQKTPASQRLSVDVMDVRAEAEVGEIGDGFRRNVSIAAGVNHITACPCTQAYNRVLFDTDTPLPLITHSQRSFTEISVERTKDAPSFPALFDCLNKALHVTSDLLKRTDEAEIVLKAHTRPQFVEDTTRETARQFGLRFADTLPHSTMVTVSSDSLESIHTHDVRARIATTLGEIASLIGRKDAP